MTRTTDASSTVTLPRMITRENLIAVADADEWHRYELTAEGNLLIMPPAGYDHDMFTNRLFRWLAIAYPGDRAFKDPSVEMGAAGLRLPDVAVFSANPQRHGTFMTSIGLRLVIEVLSDRTRDNDLREKVRDYAAAGIAHYWTVEQTAPQRVTMRWLDGEGHYRSEEPVLLDWLLDQDPHRYLGDVEA